MNTNIRNILREGLIYEASKKDTLINKIGWDESSASILDRLCGPLSVFIGNKIIEWKIKDYGEFPEGTSPQDIKKVIMSTLNGEQFVWRNTQNITSIMDWIRVGLNGNLGENKILSFWDLFRASEKWHDELEVGSGDINYVEENPIILDFRDANGNGFYWADLETQNSKEECDRMGHCGTSGAGRIYSLRQVIPLNDKYKLNKSVLTAAIGTDGIVYQMKGGKNSKPEAVYHEYIYPLLFLKKGDGYFINGFGSEYESSSDFKLTDFDDDVIREIFAKRPELFNKRSLKKKLFKLGLIDKLPEEYVSIEIEPDRVDRYIDGDYVVSSRTNQYGTKVNVGLFETILAGDTWDLWDNYDADWKGALQYHADSDSEARILEMVKAMAAKNGVEIDEDLSLEDMIEEYDEDQEIIHSIQRAVNDSESDAYVDDIYKKLKEALEELGTVERMDDSGVVLRVNVGKYIDDLEEDVYEEISDRCDDDMSCMFDEMIGEWVDKPDFRFDDRYYSPDIDNRYFNELLQERLDEIRIEEINEGKVMIKNMLRESLVPKVVNEVSKEVYDLINTKYSNSRIIMSHEPEIKFREKTQQEKGYKPNGLWYGIGPSWVNFVRSEMPTRETEHVFKIDIDESKMKIIRNYEDLLEFEKEYSTPIEGMYSFNNRYLYIDWERVARDYSGIEIAPYISEARMKHMWYYGWDLASGCIWGSGVIRKFKRLS
jgi:hypothetical protein